MFFDKIQKGMEVYVYSTLAIAFLIAGVALLLMWLQKKKDWRLALERWEAAQKALETEFQRLANLPKLSTNFLLRAPGENKKHSRTYGTRYNRLIVFDETGAGWVGLVTPQILADLKAGEYAWVDYYIPFSGPGERYTNDGPVCMDELIIDIYPLWMNKNNLDAMDWFKWADIERNFAYIYRGEAGRNYQMDIRGILNSEYRDYLRERERYRSKLINTPKPK